MADNDYQRPRRPNPETISYLKSLPLEFTAAKEEISTFLADSIDSTKEADFPSLLAASLAAIGEIQHEVASLAGDEDAAQIVEVLAHIALPHSELAARLLLKGLTGYHLHLATHRYGSHVVQTILQLAVTGSKEDMALHDDAPDLATDDLPSLQDLILEMVEELTPTSSQLAVHLCGSHVVRSLVCVLGGVQLQQQNQLRRGRVKSKKKKKKKQPIDDAAQRNAMELDYTGTFRVTMSPKTLQSFMDILWGSQKQGELQKLACHPSAGPLFILSLRVLAFSFSPEKARWQEESDDTNRDYFKLGIQKPQPQFELDSPAHRLCQRLLMLGDEDKVGDVIYGLSGEPRGSHVLETLLRVSCNDVYQLILEKGDFVASMQDYVTHDVSNFCIQALFANARTKEQAEMLLEAVEKLISSGYVVQAANQRTGILRRAAELAAKFEVHQEPILKALRMGLASKAKDDGDKDGEKKQKGIQLKDCIAPLLNLKAPVKDGDRVTLGVEGARTIYNLLRFDPLLIGGVMDGLTETLTVDELELVAKDGLGSRCIWDGILDGPKKEKAFQKADRNLLAKLSGRWVALASDRVGHHAVMKLFTNLNMEDKATLSAELAQGSNRLGGSAMGRSVMEACAVQAFLDGEQMWNDAVRKLQKDDSWLDDLLEPKEEKKKRKRKHKQGDEKETKKASKPSAVDAIMATITNAIKA